MASLSAVEMASRNTRIAHYSDFSAQQKGRKLEVPHHKNMSLGDQHWKDAGWLGKTCQKI